MYTALIERIIVSEVIYPRLAVNQEKVDEYVAAIKSGVDFDPIVVDQEYRVLDGRTRLEAYKKLDRHSVDYTVTKVKDDYEAFKISCQLNSKHGAVLSLADKKDSSRRLFRMRCSEYDIPSSDEIEDIARSLGVSKRSVYQWCADITNELKAKRNKYIMQSGGKSAECTGLSRRQIDRIRAKGELGSKRESTVDLYYYQGKTFSEGLDDINSMAPSVNDFLLKYEMMVEKFKELTAMASNRDMGNDLLRVIRPLRERTRRILAEMDRIKIKSFE